MKKFLSVILVTVIVLGCIFALSSCSEGWDNPKPETDFSTAESNLVNNNYYVIIEYRYDDDLGIGVDKVLKAYDLAPFIQEKTREAEAKGEYFSFENWKYEMGYSYSTIMENWADSRTPDLTMTYYSDTKMAEFAYDNLKLYSDYANDRQTAMEKDAKTHSESYNTDKIVDEYEAKYEEQRYEYYKYVLEHYSYELSDSERYTYQSYVDSYENGGDEKIFGKKDNVVWEGTVAAIKATSGN